MAYVTLFAYSEDWISPEEFTLYRDDYDGIPVEKHRAILRAITDMAESSNSLVNITSICHHHLDDGSECQCAQFADAVSNAVIDGRKR